MTERMLLVPHIRIQNANALSSPFTIGFPAMTAWLGAVHALQRKLNTQGITANFEAVGVVSHHFDLQTYKGPGDYENSIIGTANPLGKDGERPSFIEEARCHLEVSLVVQYSGVEKSDEHNVLEKISHYLGSGVKMAGGDILEFSRPDVYRDFSQLKPLLMPGYALIERRDLMVDAMEQGQDALDALLDYLAIHHNCERHEQNGETTVTWASQRKRTGKDEQRGWIVPIATGFHGISELGQAKNQRDPKTLHRFAEAIVTLGEFKMVYRLEHPRDFLWSSHYDNENNLYQCRQLGISPKDSFEQDGF